MLGKTNLGKQSLVTECFCAIISCLYELILKQSGCLFLLHSFVRVFSVAEIDFVPGHVHVKPAGCWGSAARHQHCPGCGDITGD